MASIQQSLNQSLYQLSLLGQLRKNSPEAQKKARIKQIEQGLEANDALLVEHREEAQADRFISKELAPRILSGLEEKERLLTEMYRLDPTTENLGEVKAYQGIIDTFKSKGQIDLADWMGEDKNYLQVEQEGLNRLNNTLITKQNQKNAMNERKQILNQYGEVIKKDGNQ